MSDLTTCIHALVSNTDMPIGETDQRRAGIDALAKSFGVTLDDPAIAKGAAFAMLALAIGCRNHDPSTGAKAWMGTVEEVGWMAHLCFTRYLEVIT